MNVNITNEGKVIWEICKKYGCGNVMEWVSAFNRYQLRQDGLPPEHAFVSVIPILCDKNDEGISLGKQTRELYDKLVEKITEGV